MHYRSHYKACPRPDENHRMTPRVARILALLDEYRLMRSTHINEFVNYFFNERYSEQTTTRWLRWLMDEGDVLRIRRDPDSKTVTQGSLHKIYGRNTRQNQALNERKNKPSLIVPHTLDVVSTIAFGVVRPCRESRGGLRFIDAPDIVQSRGSDQVKASAKPYTWPVQVDRKSVV